MTEVRGHRGKREKEKSMAGGPAVKGRFAGSVRTSWPGATAWKGVEEMYYRVIKKNKIKFEG